MFFNRSAFFVILIFTFIGAFYYKCSSRYDRSLLLTLEQGKILGRKYKSVLTGKEFHGFSGIPYAKAPIGDLRFKAPEAHEGWTGIFDATKEGNVCLQFNFFTYAIDGSEDCLFMNVYTPQLENMRGKSKSLLPVIVFIHGGGFIVGSSNKKSYGPDFLVNYEVVLVTFNYRLNIFGFLNLGISDIPGNAGLKDQLLALKWVKDNIKSFGGDPERVTLFGQSAGAASVHYQMISPQSKGLFQKSILNSGNALCSWASTTLTKEITNLLFKSVGMVGSENVTALADRLKSMNAQTLITWAMIVAVQLRKEIPGESFSFTFVPSEEDDVKGAFLPGKIETLAMNAEPMPVLTGLDESEFLILSGLAKKEVLYSAVSDNMPSLLEFQAPDIKLSNETREIVAGKVKEYYYGQKNASDETFMETIDLFSDLTFNRPLYLFLESILPTTPSAFVYSFELKGDLRSSKILNFQKVMNYPDKNATVHGDEMSYLFSTSQTSKELLSMQENVDVINKMCTLWANFAKTGDPNGDASNRTWRATTILQHSYLQIDKDMVTKDSRIFEDRITFWDELKKEYSNHTNH